MNTPVNRSTEEYLAPDIEVRGSLNALTQGGSMSGSLDAHYAVGTSSSYGGGLFS
jgi:hypothetical protein